MKNLVVVWFVFGASLAFANSTLSIETDAFKAHLEETANSEDIVGLAVAVVRGGEVTFVETFGAREQGSADKIGPDTTFRIASLSKAFAASAVSQLITEGKLSLAAPVLRFAPEFRLKNVAQAKAVTLEHILTHRTSLPPYAYDNLLEAGVAPTEILGEFRKVKPICSVGQCYAYQNVTFDMSARVIETTEGKSYQDVIKQRLFDPLGMGGASFGMTPLKKNDDWARSHRRKRGGVWRVAEVKQPYYSVPAAGGVNASIIDMAEWLKAQMGHVPEVLSGDTLERMHRPRVSTPAEVRRMRTMPKLKTAHYGLGWRVYNYAGETVVSHAGSVEGYSAQIAFMPGRDVGIVLLTNSRSRVFFEILPAFLDLELANDEES